MHGHGLFPLEYESTNLHGFYISAFPKIDKIHSSKSSTFAEYEADFVVMADSRMQEYQDIDWFSYKIKKKNSKWYCFNADT